MIRESIDSILAQTHARFELIVVNDGSTDEDRRDCGRITHSGIRVSA
jgi:glycosyltransferase involved in cell wall biosynthesis